MDKPSPQKETQPFIFGEGRISGYISSALAVAALLGVIAFKFPGLLTTAELRGSLYTEQFARSLLLLSLITRFAMGTISYILNDKKFCNSPASFFLLSK